VDRNALAGVNFQKSLGVCIQGNKLRLALVARRIRSIRLLDTLTLSDFRQKPAVEIRDDIARFLARNKAAHFRCVMAVSRQHVIVRQVDLPREAEANLAKVVEYQLAVLVPSESAAICYDFCFSKQTPQSKSLQVTVFLVMKSWLDQALQLCESLGLQVDVVLPSSIAIANYALLNRQFKVETALITHWQEGQCEMVGVLKNTFYHSREITSSEEGELSEALQTEIEFFRGRADLPEEAPLDVWIMGNAGGLVTAPGEKRFRFRRFSLLQDFGIEIVNRSAKVSDVQDQFLALAAGLVGLKKKNPITLNLLPVERRLRKSRWTWVPTYGLLGLNLLLLLSLIVRRPIQERIYSVQLSREVARLEPEVRRIHFVENEIADLRRRTSLLTEFRNSNQQVLDALNELSKILPKNTWVFDFNMRNEAMEVYGASQAAAALPQMLDNSPYFKEAEFVAPILKDGLGNEIYRIRMKLEQAGSAVGLPSTTLQPRTKLPEKAQVPRK
jgi:Tfp pilus assembly protein PilN